MAGVLETFGVLLGVLGLWTRPGGCILAGQMAVAYVWLLAGVSAIWWWAHGGELAMLFSFIFLFFSAWGAGPFSVDARLAAKRE